MEKEIRGNILDIGTREGFKLENILKRIKEEEIDKVVAIEPSPLNEETKMRFTGNEKVQIIKKRIEDAEFPTNSFDTILMFDVVEHLFSIEDAMIKITSWLKPNGVFICSTPNKWIYRITSWLSLKKTEPTHVNRMDYKCFIKLMNTYFEKIKFLGTFPYMRLGKRFPKIFKINPFLSSLLTSWMWLTVYCFATILRKRKGDSVGILILLLLNAKNKPDRRITFLFCSSPILLTKTN